MIGPEELEALGPGAVVINVGRGAVIQEAALVRALQERRLRGAALDVFDTEPLPPGHPFYRLDNVLLSPHCADHVPGWLDDAMQLFIENLERFRAGLPLQNLVDRSAGY
jgi:phosphoglycerate dehydrogenase-like enzyme